jgi:mRNA interferase MazF
MRTHCKAGSEERRHCYGRASGEFSKPRPALILQHRLFAETENVTVALITSDLSRASYVRVGVEPDTGNGLRKPSEVMLDNIQTLSMKRIGDVIGQLDHDSMIRVWTALLIFFGIDQVAL